MGTSSADTYSSPVLDSERPSIPAAGGGGGGGRGGCFPGWQLWTQTVESFKVSQTQRYQRHLYVQLGNEGNSRGLFLSQQCGVSSQRSSQQPGWGKRDRGERGTKEGRGDLGRSPQSTSHPYRGSLPAPPPPIPVRSARSSVAPAS